MGGVLICISILVPTLLWSDLSNPFVWVVTLSTVAFGAIGFVDDYIKVVHRTNQGLTARQKLGLQLLVSAAVAITLLNLEGHGNYSTRLVVPFAKHLRPDLVWNWLGHIPHLHWLAFLPFVVFVMIVIAGASNAVNLTDGLDGLAIGCTIVAAVALTMLTYVSGHVVFSDYLELQRMPLVSELTIFCGSMVGASIGFLWYNAHPAEIFMGDVGSLGSGRSDRHRRRRHQAGAAVALHRRRLHPRRHERRPAGRQLQAAQGQAHLQDGPAAPPLRAARLVGVEGHRPLLDPRPHLRPVGTDDPEAALELHSRSTIVRKRCSRCTMR